MAGRASYRQLEWLLSRIINPIADDYQPQL